MSAQQQQNFKKLQKLSQSVQQHIKDIARSKQLCKARVQHLMNQKYEQEELEEDLDTFVAAYSFGKNTTNPFAQEAEIHEIDKKLVQLQNGNQNDKLKEILDKIKARGEL